MIGIICGVVIFAYFFFWTCKMRRKQLKEWEQIGHVEEVDELEGWVTQTFTQKKRHSHQHWYIEVEASVYIQKENQKCKVIWKRPLLADTGVPHIQPQQKVRLHGRRVQDDFYANRIILE